MIYQLDPKGQIFHGRTLEKKEDNPTIGSSRPSTDSTGQDIDVDEPTPGPSGLLTDRTGQDIDVDEPTPGPSGLLTDRTGQDMDVDELTPGPSDISTDSTGQDTDKDEDEDETDFLFKETLTEERQKHCRTKLVVSGPSQGQRLQ